jgi:uncharacterized membrane protein YjjP (DUF1212 family)
MSELPPDDPAPTSTSPIGIADSLTIRSEAAAAVGSALLAGGMASYRVKRAMARTARALGLDSFVAIVSFTDITATATLDGRYRTRITQPSHVGVNVDHLHRTQRMVDELPDGVGADEVFARVAAITARGPLHPAPLNALAAGFACAAFAFLNQGGPIEMIAVLVAATLGQAVRRRLQRREWNHLLVTLVAALVSSSLYLAAIRAGEAAGWFGAGHLGGYMSAVLFLVPGFPLITGILDIVRSDYAAGLQRLTYSVLIILGAAVTIWTVALVAGAEVGPPDVVARPFAAELLLRAGATAVGVLGFALLFNSPWRIALAAAGVSTLANSARFALTEGGMPTQLATFAATVLVGVLAYLIARRAHVPRTSLSVPAVVIMIPGFAMYSAFTLLNSGEPGESVLMMQEAVQVVLAAAFGLAVAHLATSQDWRRAAQPH